MTVDEYFNKYAEMDANILADRTKLMSIEEFRQAVGWRDREILSLIDEMIDKYDVNYFEEILQAETNGRMRALIELKEKIK